MRGRARPRAFGVGNEEGLPESSEEDPVCEVIGSGEAEATILPVCMGEWDGRRKK